MTTALTITVDQLRQLGDLLEQRCGIRVGDALHTSVEEGLARLMAKLGMSSFEEFFEQARDPEAGLRDDLVNAMVSRESWWFRDPETLTAFVTQALPECEARASQREDARVRIWSAGCSTGQEPYSLLMSLIERRREADLDPALPDSYEIVATDVSPAALFLAVAGRYGAQTIAQGLADELRERYFDQEGSTWCLADAVRQRVRFRQHNVLDPLGELAHRPFDFIFLRHVLEYFSPAMQELLLANIADALRAEGLLFLGQSEELPAESAFAAVPLDDCTAYRRRP